MTVFTIHISDDNQKKKYLLGLIKEIAKTEKGISINRSYQLNDTTLEAIEEIEKGKTYKSENLEDLFKKLEE